MATDFKSRKGPGYCVYQPDKHGKKANAGMVKARKAAALAKFTKPVEVNWERKDDEGQS